jgi:hypothetical protein
MFKIYKGGEYFFQWDLGQRLEMTEDFTSVHFCNQTEDCALVCDTYIEDGIRLVNVPNVLLQNTNNIRVYGCYAEGDNVCFAKDYQIFRVIKRGKPEEYVYTEEDVLNYRRLDRRITELEENGGSSGGSFKKIGFSADCDYIATDTDGRTAFSQAIADAAEGDTILVMAGEYKGETTLNIDKDLTFISSGDAVINFSVKTQGGGDFSYENWEWTTVYEGKHTKWYGFTFNKYFDVGVNANPDNAYYNGFVTVKNCSFNYGYCVMVGNFTNCAFNLTQLTVGHYYGADESTFTDCKFSCSIEANVGSDNFKRCDFHFNGNNYINFTTWKENNFVNCKMYAPNDILTMQDSHAGGALKLNDTVIFAVSVVNGSYGEITGGFLFTPTAIN